MKRQSTVLQKGIFLWSCVLSSTNLTLEWLHGPLPFPMPLQMIQLVIITHSVWANIILCIYSNLSSLIFIIVAPRHYISDSGILRFSTGDSEQCHGVRIVDDDICGPELKQFLSSLTLVSGSPVTVNPPSTRVVIDDSLDPECSKWCFTLCWGSLKLVLIAYT